MQILIKFFITIILVFLQLSFFKGLGLPWFNINLLLVLAVFLIINYGLDDNLIPLTAGALLLDLFSSTVFGVVTVSCVLSFFLINFVYLYLFTNKTLSSLVVLGVFGSLSYFFIMIIFGYLFNWLNLTAGLNFINNLIWYNLIWQIVFIVIFLIIAYLLNKIFAKQHDFV